MADGGLKIATVGGHHSLSDGLNRIENNDRIEKEIIHNLELAVKWNIPALIVFSGNRNGLPDAQGVIRMDSWSGRFIMELHNP